MFFLMGACWCCAVAQGGAVGPAEQAGVDKSAKTAAVVWLHGLGDKGSSWRSVVRGAVAKSSAILDHVAWQFPTAPTRPVSMNGGSAMTAWYDVKGLDPSASEDSEGYAASVERVGGVIAGLIERNPLLTPQRVVVGGFSQGAVISLAALLSGGTPLAGVVALSGYLPEREKLSQRLEAPLEAGSRREVPVLMCHGRKDPLIKLEWARLSHQLMRDSGMNISWMEYPVAHSASDGEILDVLDFIASLLPPWPPAAAADVNVQTPLDEVRQGEL